MLGISNESIFWLKEFSKSWINIVSNKVVYCEQFFEKDSWGVSRVFSSGTYIKDYLSLKLWLEILFKIKRGLEFEFYVALIESSDSVNIEEFGMIQSSRDVNFINSRKDDTMLVNIINKGQNPKSMRSPLPVRSIVRLHRFDIRTDVFSKAIESSGEFTVPLKVDWEDGKVVTFDCKRPSDIVEGSAEPVGKLTYQESPRLRELLHEIRAEDIESILRVFLNGTSVRVTCDEGSDFTVEDIKVFLRPIDSSEGVSHWLHMLYYPQGENNGRKETKDSKGARNTRAHKTRVPKQFNSP